MTAITAGLKRLRVGWTSSSPARRECSHSHTQAHGSLPPPHPIPPHPPPSGENAPLSKPLIGLAPNSLRASPHPSHTDQVAVDFSNSSANILVERLSGWGGREEEWGTGMKVRRRATGTRQKIMCGALWEVKRISGPRRGEDTEKGQKGGREPRRGKPREGEGATGPGKGKE
jgi:hypothetical protein